MDHSIVLGFRTVTGTVAHVCAAAGLVAGCGSESTFVLAPWPEDHFGVVVFATDERVWPPTVVAPDMAGQLPIPEVRGRLFARSFDRSLTASDGTPLSECGAVSGGNGSAFPAPDGAWVTEPFAGPDRPPPFGREIEPLRALDLRLETCSLERDPCRRVRLEPMDDLADFTALGAASTGADQLWVGGQRSTQPGEPRLVYVNGGDAEDRTALVASVGPVLSLAALSADQLLGIGPRRTLFSLDDEGVGPAPEIIDAIRLAGSPGFNALTFTSTVVVELNASERVETFGFGERVDGIFRYRDRALVLTEARLLSRSGGRWQPEQVTLLTGSARLGGDEDVLVAAGGLELVAARQNAGPWRNFPTPADGGFRLEAAGGLGSGDFVVVGDRGLIAVWTDDGWCTSADDAVDYELAVSDPDLPQTWVIGATRDGAARIVKVRVADDD